VTAERRKRWFAALAIALGISFALLAHFAIIDGLAPAWGALLSLVPVAGFALWAARRSRRRAAAFAAIALLAVALWLGWAALERNFQSVFFVEHAAANLILAFVFGRTLVGSREPLCTRFARLLHGALPPEEVRYSRQVTVAWTVFFAALFAISCALYLGGFIAAWAMFASILTPILVAAMFVIEYAIRRRALPQSQRTGVLGAVRAFSRYFATAQVEAPR
jgi:uncharacterized membrane protein